MKVFKESCKNCLLSKDRIVSPARAKEIIEKCKQTQQHFICHKASIKGEGTCCHQFFVKLGPHSQLVRIAQQLNAIEFVEQTDQEELIPYNQRKR